MLDVLLHRARGRDREALAEIAERFQPLVLATAQRLSREGSSWMDLVQEGYLALVEAVFDFNPRGGAPFPWYARRRVYYAIYNYRRKELGINRHEDLILDRPREDGGEGILLDFLPAVGEGPEEEVLCRRSYQHLRLALARLPEKQRRVLKGLYFEGRGVTELAREMGITPPSVKGLEARGLKNLARQEVFSRPLRG